MHVDTLEGVVDVREAIDRDAVALVVTDEDEVYGMGTWLRTPHMSSW